MELWGAAVRPSLSELHHHLQTQGAEVRGYDCCRREDVIVFARYLDWGAVCCMVVGSAGVHCLFETLGRWGQGLCPLTECSVEQLEEEKRNGILIHT